jgi:hypothetical protein
VRLKESICFDFLDISSESERFWPCWWLAGVIIYVGDLTKDLPDYEVLAATSRR